MLSLRVCGARTVVFAVSLDLSVQSKYWANRISTGVIHIEDLQFDSLSIVLPDNNAVPRSLTKTQSVLCVHKGMSPSEADR